MAGVDVGGGGGGKRREMDSQVNMIPMIDLLMVTISFLLITAVWTHMSRIDADAQVPSTRVDVPPPPPDGSKTLHVMMQSPDKFMLAWKQGQVTVDSFEMPRKEVVVAQGGAEMVRYPELAAEIQKEWGTKGQHTGPLDVHLDQAVLHADDKTEFKYLVGVMDAIESTGREVSRGGKTTRVPAFNITFAVN